jgi:hypothetical protein
MSQKAAISKLEEAYRQTVAGLRGLGHHELADFFEGQQFLLYGNPDAPHPEGILTMSGETLRFDSTP